MTTMTRKKGAGRATGMIINMPVVTVLPANQVGAAITDINNWWSKLSESIAQTSIRIGKYLVEMQDDCKKAGINFGDLFPKTADDRGPGKLPFSWNTANRLMAISRNSALTNSEHVQNRLPADWGSLYELSRVEPKKLTKLIDEGRVSPDMGRPAIKKLVSEARPVNATKKPAKNKSSNHDEDQEWDIAKRIFMRIKDPKLRIAEFVKLANDCGISLDEVMGASK